MIAPIVTWPSSARKVAVAMIRIWLPCRMPLMTEVMLPVLDAAWICAMIASRLTSAARCSPRVA